MKVEADVWAETFGSRDELLACASSQLREEAAPAFPEIGVGIRAGHQSGWLIVSISPESLYFGEATGCFSSSVTMLPAH